jgi:hypothetical protein
VLNHAARHSLTEELIMNMTMESLVANGPQLAAIWLVLLVLAAGSLTALADRGGMIGPQRVAARLAAQVQQRHRVRAQQAAQAADSARYTEEITIAAQRATVTVQRRRGQWQDAQQQLDAAYGACQEADERVRQACRAAAYPSPAFGLTPAHYADRERYLHNAAVQAQRNGHLSTARLRDALAHRNGWDPRLHPADQDVVLAQATRGHLQHLYQRAVAAERAAWHEAGAAVAAARTLRSEANTAQSAVYATRSAARNVFPLTGLRPATT